MAVVAGGAHSIEHAQLCADPRITLKVNGPRRRLVCATCSAFAELPTGEDYDAAWRELGARQVLLEADSLDLPPPPTPFAPPVVVRNEGECFHGIPYDQHCPRCGADESMAYGTRPRK